MELFHYIDNYGYLAIFLGGIFEGETILVLGGLLAHQDIFRLEIVILLAFLGAVVGDSSWFLLGRYYPSRITNRFKILNGVINKSKVSIDKNPELLSFLVRFMYGFRHIVPYSLGLSKISTFRFIFFNSLGSLIWALIIGLSGYWFGDIIRSYFGSMKHGEIKIIVFIIIFISIMLAIFRLTRYLIRLILKKEQVL